MKKKNNSLGKLNKRLACLVFGLMSSTGTMAFTQIGGGGAIPMGHEWLTRTSALEVLNAEHVIAPDPQDPRVDWQDGLAKNLNLSNAQAEVNRLKSIPNNNARYEPRYDDVYAAIMGERWVDTAGFNVVKSTVGKLNCFDAVAQEPADLQQDHFMRRYDDIGGQGGIESAQRAQQRFIRHFVNAAIADEKSIKIWDGGTYSSQKKIDHNYFLFGRAVHLFQDSFSPEHTVRLAEDNYEKVHQVKAYLCTEGAEQHTHTATEAISFTSGDVIWKEDTRLNSGWETYKISNMKTVALVAMEASKDLWAAFIRTMAVSPEEREEIAQQEAQTLVDNWLSFDEEEMLDWYEKESHRDHTYVLEKDQAGPGMSQFDCMVGLGVTSGNQAERVLALDKLRRQCLYNVEPMAGYSDLNDPYMDISYNWQWTSVTWQTPSSNWKIPQLEADIGKKVVIKNSVNGAHLTAPDGIKHNANVYSKTGEVLELILVGDPNNEAYFRAKNDADLFLSYSAYSGKALLYNSPNQAAYRVKQEGVLWSIENTYWNDYLWFSSWSKRPYVSGTGNPDKAHSQWIIEGL